MPHLLLVPPEDGGLAEDAVRLLVVRLAVTDSRSESQMVSLSKSMITWLDFTTP